MLTIGLKKHLWWEHTVSPNLSSRKIEFLVWIIFIGIIIEIIIFAVLINYVFFSNNNSYALVANTLITTTRKTDIKLGLETEEFVKKLEGFDFKPKLIQEYIKRTPFSVKGAMISLNGDNIQIFEYPDHDTASKEATIFAQKYTGDKTRNKWKNITNIYVRDKIVVFYMGRNELILATLNKNLNSLSINKN